MSDTKDRLGEKMRDAERAREDQYAAERDRELIEKLRKKQEELRNAAGKAADAMGMLCPKCQRPLEARTHGGLEIMACPADDGAWLESAALKAVLKGSAGASQPPR